MLENLPLCVLELILSYTKTSTIINVICCSHKCQQTLEPLLWNSSKIVLSICDFQNVMLDRAFRNMKHASSLDISSRDLSNSTAALVFNVGINFTKLLSNIDPRKMVSLRITDSISHDYIRCLIEVLPFLRQLTIKSVSLDDWKALPIGSSLKKIYFKDCNIDNELVQLISDGNELEEVIFYDCDNITDQGIRFLSSSSALLTCLRLCNIDKDLDIHCLDALTNLSILRLESIFVSDDFVINVCNKLEKLKGLTLIGLALISDNALSKIDMLQEIETLSIIACTVTNKMFSFLELSTSLQNLEVNSTDIVEKETCFDNIKNLQVIKFVIDDATDTFDVLQVFNLCASKWVLSKVERDTRSVVFTKLPDRRELTQFSRCFYELDPFLKKPYYCTYC